MTRITLAGRGRSPRDGRGLATLSWLLITAAVAGLAALAVVVVQAQVEDTAERISNSEARIAAALHSAFAVETDAKAAPAEDFDLWAEWESHFSQRYGVIAVLNSDTEVAVVGNHFVRAAGGGTTFAPAAAAAADEQPPNANKAQVQCTVG